MSTVKRPGAAFGKIVLCVCALWFFSAGLALAQDLEPRRWTHLPTGLNVLGVGTSLASGDITLDPVLEIENGTYELGGAGFVYLRTFGLFGKSARFDVLAPYAYGRWEGTLQGEPASTHRNGWADPRFRLSVLLWGGLAQSPKEFASTPKSDTVVGAALSVTAPWGEYYPDLLINLGSNRTSIRPQLGVTHTRDKWSYELTGSVFVFQDNDNFRGARLEQDPIWALQGHVIYTFRPGLWASASTAYGFGGSTTVGGVDRGIEVGNWLISLAVGLPVNRQQGVKFAWVRARTQEPTGSDFDSLNLSWQYIFGF